MPGGDEDMPFSRCDAADNPTKPGPEQMERAIGVCVRRLCASGRDYPSAKAAVVAVYKEAELKVGTAREYITVQSYEDRTTPEFVVFTFWQLVEKLARKWLTNKRPSRPDSRLPHPCREPGGCKCGCPKS
jgi:hypothetical protein